MRPIVRDIVLNAALPAVVYSFARRNGWGEVPALLWAAALPAALSVVGIVRERTVSPIGAIALFAIAVSIIGAELGGGPKVLLIRESFVTGALGVACLVSLLLPRPLMFYFGRYFETRGNRAAAAAFDARWSNPLFRRVNRIITLVWAGAFLGELALRVLLVFTLPPVAVLAIAPIVLGVITVGTIVWTYRYIAAVRRRAAA